MTLLIASSDALLVWVNYQSARVALHQTLSSRGKQLQDAYQMTLEQVGSHMRQTATYIANDEHVNRLFLAGKLAVEQEGGGPGGLRAAAIREELLSHVATGWEEMTKHYKGRQLHFHLAPDISFLRVHRPDKFGDDLSDIRHSIVAANTSLQATMGFESGRVYAGVRGVVPVFAKDEEGHAIHIGALEAGTSFALMLEQLKNVLSAEFAVLMTLDHAQETMWPDFLKEYTKTHAVVSNHLLEAGTNAAQARLLLKTPQVRNLLGREETTLLLLDGGPTAVTSFALRDYLGTVNPERGDIGTILVWTPAEKEVNAFQHGLHTNLTIAIIGFILIEVLIYWAMRSESRLRRTTAMALTDSLTGIPNRRYFEMNFPREISRARRYQNAVSVIFCDIDHFKQYNDQHGHLNGDRCIQKVALTLQERLKRAGEFVARYGGEEFVVVLPSIDNNNAVMLADELRMAVETLAIEHQASSVAPHVTISCGVATMHPVPSHDVDGSTLLHNADEALYRAKTEGRNRVVDASS